MPGNSPVILDRVALRKESVDRNFQTLQLCALLLVALRKESVDRNAPFMRWVAARISRSPQGERG